MFGFLRFTRLSVAVLAVTVSSCANVNGIGSGGMGGTGGAGGTGGTGDGTVVLEPLLEPVPSEAPMSFAAEPPRDAVDTELGVALGEVSGACDSGSCSGSDPADQWSILPSASGEHRIRLTWASASSDLDLFLIDTNGAPIDSSVQEGTVPEVILASLMADRVYVIQVQTFDTFGENQAYNLAVERSE
jgi:hypothetical protein